MTPEQKAAKRVAILKDTMQEELLVVLKKTYELNLCRVEQWEREAKNQPQEVPYYPENMVRLGE